MVAFGFFILIVVVLNIQSIQASCPSNEEVVCQQKICGQVNNDLCKCQCINGYYRDFETKNCVNVCNNHFGHGPELFCKENERVICKEATCSFSDETRCSCQCKDDYYKDLTSNTCVKHCPT